YQCAPGDELKVTTGACDKELAALDACRANAGGSGGSNGTTGTGGSKGTGSGGSGVAPGSDLTGSPECDGFCAKVEMCGLVCDRAFDCTGGPGECAAATSAFLSCVAGGNALTCSAGGF